MMWLTDPDALRPERVGNKAAGLARMLRAGFAVPDGFVLEPGEPVALVRAAVEAAGEGTAWAVRSSAVAEDLPGTSYAGQYESCVDVRSAEEVCAAVDRVRASALGNRVTQYGLRNRRSPDGQGNRDIGDRGALNGRIGSEAGMAVLIQRFVSADVSGVAFSADPVTGDRSAVVISAVRGIGVSVVGGSTDPEEWRITAADTACSKGDILGAAEAKLVADTVRRVEAITGWPPDIEWAMSGGELYLLQVRPMTAVPRVVTWTAPDRGAWFRGLRLGEWLPEPVTALCATWLLPGLEERLRIRQREDGGFLVPGRMHVLVNGWYFHSPLGEGGSALLFLGLLRRPRLAVATVVGRRYPNLAENLFVRRLAVRWRTEIRPMYEAVVAEAEAAAGIADAAGLVRLIDRLIAAAGDCFWSAVLAGGAAWRAEEALHRLSSRWLPPDFDPVGRPLQAPGRTRIGRHATFSLDWMRPTLGELDLHSLDTSSDAVSAATVDSPAGAADGGPESLAGERLPRYGVTGRRLRRFERVLGAARRAAALRQDHTETVTLAWPVLRRALLRLGELRGLPGADDVFHLTRDELVPAEMPAEFLAEPHDTEFADAEHSGPKAGDSLTAGAAETQERRRQWAEQRRLSPPARLGRPPFLLRRMLLPKMELPVSSATVLRGHAASPGRATGPVRILREPSELDGVRAGEILVATAAVPALTVTYARIAALCTDSGSAAAHAAVVAREYAVPAVMGLRDAMERLHNGQIVTVDGTRGLVEL